MKKTIKLVIRLIDPLRLTVGMVLRKNYDKSGKTKIHFFNQMDYDDREVYYHYRSLWRPVELYGVCDDKIQQGDQFLSGEVGNPELANKIFTFLGKIETDLVEVETEDGAKIISTKHLLDKAKKVVATHEQIIQLNEGVLVAGINTKHEPSEKDIEFILDNGGKCYLEMETTHSDPTANDWSIRCLDKKIIIHLSEDAI